MIVLCNGTDLSTYIFGFIKTKYYKQYVFVCVCVSGRDAKWPQISNFVINGQIFAHFEHKLGNNFGSKNFSQSLQ